MAELENESVHLIVTSPPYWQLKDYGSENQIGFNDNYEDYINNLNLVWNECYRVLNKGCRLCINIGDQFARSVYYGRYKVIPIRTEIIKFCETIGFDYMGAIIWQKTTTMNTTGGASVMGSFPYPRNGIVKLDYEFILLFKKIGQQPPVNNQVKELSKLTQKEWNEYFLGHWYFNGVRQEDHLAMFPEELPKRLIKMFSFVGDTVLDPFLGSGTTTLAAKNLNRNSVGYEINKNFLSIIKNKIGAEKQDLFKDNSFEFVEQKTPQNNFKNEIANLPYIFKDPIKFDRKIDPKKLSFGSKIDQLTQKKESLFTVKDILSSKIILLNNGLSLRLIGIEDIQTLSSKAVDFLIQKIKGKKVFFKFDSRKYDKDNNLLCYLYLENKTFVNAHLLKNKLATVDLSQDFKYKEKFINLLK